MRKYSKNIKFYIGNNNSKNRQRLISLVLVVACIVAIVFSVGFSSAKYVEENGKLVSFDIHQEYTLIFNSNAPGGKTVIGDMQNQTVSGDTETKLNTNQFSVDGYNFKGWSRSSAGEVEINDEGTITLDSSVETQKDINLYAVWEIATYTVKFDANNGTKTMGDQIINCGDSTPLNANEFTRVGYSFSGWNTEADGTGTSYSDGQSVTDIAPKGDFVTLFAQWAQNILTYVPNTGAVDSLTANYGPTAYNLRINHCDGVRRQGSNIAGTAVDYPDYLYDQTYQIPLYSYQPSDKCTFVGYSDDLDKFNYGILRKPQDNFSNLCSEDGDTKNIYAVWHYDAPATLELNTSANGKALTMGGVNTYGTNSGLGENRISGWDNTQTIDIRGFRYIVFELRFDQNADISVLYPNIGNCQLELSSAGESDVSEMGWELGKLFNSETLQGLNDGQWHKVALCIDDGRDTGGSIDLSKVNFLGIKWNNPDYEANTVTGYIRNLSFYSSCPSDAKRLKSVS